MSLINTIIEKARGDLKCVAFPEATEEKILLAARDCVDRKICNPLLVGDEDEIINVANKLNISLENIDIYDTFNEVKIEKLINRFFTINTIFSVKSLKRKSKDRSNVCCFDVASSGRCRYYFCRINSYNWRCNYWRSNNDWI